jgi:hypothetical protein
MTIPVLKNISTFFRLPSGTSLLIFFVAITALPACKVKEGCPTKGFTNTMEKTTKHGKSNLFDKKMRKKMKG